MLRKFIQGWILFVKEDLMFQVSLVAPFSEISPASTCCSRIAFVFPWHALNQIFCSSWTFGSWWWTTNTWRLLEAMVPSFMKMHQTKLKKNFYLLSLIFLFCHEMATSAAPESFRHFTPGEGVESESSRDRQWSLSILLHPLAVLLGFSWTIAEGRSCLTTEMCMKILERSEVWKKGKKVWSKVALFSAIFHWPNF